VLHGFGLRVADTDRGTTAIEKGVVGEGRDKAGGLGARAARQGQSPRTEEGVVRRGLANRGAEGRMKRGPLGSNAIAASVGTTLKHYGA